jgi:hypothetical protein
MTKKTMLRILIAAGMLAMVLLAVQVITTESAPVVPSVDAAAEERLSGSDNINLHPPVPLPANYYTGSDWIERHPVSTPLPANYYTGSDWIERHPCLPTP